MTRYVIDTNVYMAADRDLAWAEELERFSTAYLPFIHFHAVVAQELLAGAIHQRREKLVEHNFSNPLNSGEESWSRALQLGRVQDGFCPTSSNES